MKIKILVDAHIFDLSYQGTTTYIEGLYNALAMHEEFEIVLCAKNVTHIKSIFPHPNFKFIQLKSRSKYKRLAFEIPAIIRKEKIDFAHFQYITPLMKGCKFINTIHDLLFLDFPEYFPWSYRVSKKFLFRSSARKSDVICTVSEFSKKSLIKHFKLDPAKIVVTPNAVSPMKKMDSPSELDKSPYILCVGRFEPRKNQLQLLEAYKELKLHERGYHLVFVGGRKERIEIDYFKKLNTQLNSEIRPFVHFYENLDREKLCNLYQNAAVFVFPSLAEGFGIPPLEAGLAGVKVICSNQTAMQDFDFFKYHYNPKKESLNKLLEAALNDSQYPFEATQAKISSSYNWEAIADEFARTLLNIPLTQSD